MPFNEANSRSLSVNSHLQKGLGHTTKSGKLLSYRWGDSSPAYIRGPALL
jgi:hypothetical protein